MVKIIIWSLIAILIVGGVAAHGFIPKSWLERLPAIVQIAAVACAILYCIISVLSFVIDSEFFQKIFKKK